MDDGFQSARIHIDYAILVVDGRRGLGNGHIIPGGPMRAPLLDQLRLADAILKMGEGSASDKVIRMASRANKPVFEASARPREAEALAGRRFLAFAGIGNPEKFFDTVRETGGEVVIAKALPDHHVFTADDFEDLTSLAASNGLDLITTAKDAIRLKHGTSAEQAFLKRLTVLEIDAVFELSHAPERIIKDTLVAWRKRVRR
jgi:tetraacyldisaccharide 4'-kinase